MDLVRISLLPAVTPLNSVGWRKNASSMQLPQLPLGQRMMLARRGPARVVAGLIAQGPEHVARIALDNAFLTESQLLKVLAKENLPARIVAAVARHEKCSTLVNVRVALLRHAHAPAECVATFVPDLPQRELEDLLGLSRLPGSVRSQLREELARRETRGSTKTEGDVTT